MVAEHRSATLSEKGVTHMNSSTAHLTSYVWHRHGLSHPALTSRLGWLVYWTMAPVQAGYRYLGRGPTFEAVLLWRHALIDRLLSHAVEETGVTQIIELAAGWSGRGWRFKRKYGARITYLESDLAGVARRKRAVLEDAGILMAGHDVAVIDALSESGDQSLAAVASRRFDPTQRTAIVTEGLLNYIPRPVVEALWRRIALVLGRFPHGVYLSDLYVGDKGIEWIGSRAFRAALSALTMNRTYIDFPTSDAAAQALTACGFDTVQVHDPARLSELVSDSHLEGGALVRVLEGVASSSAPGTLAS